MADRSDWTVKVYRLGEEPDALEADAHLTPEQRVAMIWELTRTACLLGGKLDPDAPMRRDVVRILKRPGEPEREQADT